jgi:hypothetical protein
MGGWDRMKKAERAHGTYLVSGLLVCMFLDCKLARWRVGWVITLQVEGRKSRTSKDEPTTETPNHPSPQNIMKRLLLLCGFLLTISLNACQCSWKPDVGPVEDEEEAAVMQRADPDELTRVHTS